MYETQHEPGGCRETLAITRAVFGVLLPLLGGMIAVIALVVFAVVLFAQHPALALVPVALLIAGAALFARWERGRDQSG